MTETKPDSSFPESRFLLEQTRKPHRLDVSAKIGGLLVFVNKSIPSKYLQSFHFLGDIQAILLEITLKQRKL